MTSTYFVLYLKGRGYDARDIGAILSFSSITLLAGQYFWGGYCYKYSWLSHKNIIYMCLVAGIFTNLVIPLSNAEYFVTLLLYAFFTFTFSSAGPMIDAWTMFRKHDTPAINFGLTRGIGSGAYALAAVGFGVLFSFIGLTYMFVIANLFVLLAITVATFIDKGNLQDSRKVSKIAGHGALVYPLRHTRFLALLISVSIVFTATASNNSFYGLLIAELGGDSGDFGLGIFLSAMSEVPVMVLSTWMLTKISARILLLYSLGFYILRAALLAMADTLVVAILAQLAQSFSFGLFLPVTVAYIAQIVRKSEITVAYMLIISACYGLAGIVGNTVGGQIAQIYGLRVMYTFNLLITIIGVVVFAGSLIFTKPEPDALMEA